MTTPGGSAPDGAYVVGGRYGQDVTEASAKAIMTGKTKTAFSNAQDQHKINVGNPLTSLFGSVSTLFGKVEENNDLIQVQGQQLEDLTTFVGTGTTTPAWATTGGRDLVTFPDTMMQPVLTSVDTSSSTVANHTHSIPSSGSTTGSNGGHSHSVNSTFTMKPPAFKPGSGVADFAFLRGGRDTPTPLEAIRIITGNDDGLLGISAWYLGIYVLRVSDNVMVKLWQSPNLVNVLTNQRQRYHIATGMTQEAQNDQLLAIASLQIASGIGQSPRSIGCIFQTGISEQTGTIPPARHAYITGQSTLPAGVGINSGFFNWDKTKLMWGALGESAT